MASIKSIKQDFLNQLAKSELIGFNFQIFLYLSLNLANEQNESMCIFYILVLFMFLGVLTFWVGGRKERGLLMVDLKYFKVFWIKIYLQTKLQSLSEYVDMERDQSKPCNQILSPGQFIINCQDPDLYLLSLDYDYPKCEQPLAKVEEELAKTSSCNQKKRLAGVRTRERKKEYLTKLQENVKRLQAEVEACDDQLLKSKDQLLKSLQKSSQLSNEHSFIFLELEKLMEEEYPDIDRINLLLDILKNRIGANGRERQANLDYSFKQMINSILPGMHRYVMNSAIFEDDIFDQSFTAEELGNLSKDKWNAQLYSGLKLSQEQLEEMRTYGSKLTVKRRQTVQFIKRLRNVKEEIKKQEEIFENKIFEFRQEMDPIQSSRMVVFGEKNKLRKQFSLGDDLYQVKVHKKVKLQ